MKNYYDIKLPDNIDEFTLKAIEEGEKYKKKLTMKRKNITIAASLALIILLGVSSTTLAKGYISNVFSIVKDFITIRGNNKEAVGVNITAEDNGVSITVQEVMCDDVGVYASFIVRSKKPFINVKDSQLLMSERSSVSFTNKPASNGIMKGKFIDSQTFVGINTYLFTGIDTKIPKEFTLDLDINAIKLNGVEDGMENIVLGNWKISIPVELNGKGVRIIYPNAKENDVTIKMITLSKLHTKIEAELPMNYSGKLTSIITDKGVSVNHNGFSVKEKDDKVQIVNIFDGIPEDTKYITIGYENLSKINIDLKKKYKQVEEATDNSVVVEKNSENENSENNWLYTKTKEQLPIHEYSGLFSYSYKFTSNKGDITRYSIRKKDKLQHIYVTNEGKRLEIYEVTDNELILKHVSMLSSSESETGEYFDKQPNENKILLKFPIKLGTKWDNYEIVDEIANLPSSIPTNESEVLKVERTTDKKIEEFYYAKVFGLIKYKSVDKTSGTVLEEFQLKEYKELSR